MRLSRSLAVVWLLILVYGVYFSAFSIERHRAFLTHASDLGQIDQAIWNTLHGRLLEYTKATGVQSNRFSDHVEPIFIPLSLVFLVYDNVEALLIVQSFAIAIGALAVFWIARKTLGATHFSSASHPGAEWPAVGFAAIYLLFPALEAANLAEFHAVTLAPAPLLFAYHYGTEKAWGRYLLFSILALAVKEEIALLVFVMAVWFWIEPVVARQPSLGGLLRPPALRRFSFSTSNFQLSTFNFQLPTSNLQPLGTAILALVWFVFAVFVVIPHFNALGRSPYTCRYVVGEDCPEIARGLFLDARLGYLGQLLASVGWIALLDPISLLLGLPLIALNVVSNYPAQYSGTFHYSAPVAPYLVLAAIGGYARLSGWMETRRKDAGSRRQGDTETRRHGDTESQSPRPRVPVSPRLVLLVIPVFLLALAYHLIAGYTPIAGAFKWPSLTSHNQLFARFAAQIPPEASVSTTPSLNPHLSHRRVLYRYLNVKDAQYVLLDVSESTNSNPIDFRVTYNGLVDTKTFGVVDAADGYVLLERGAPPKPLPDEFFSIFRANGRQPQHPVTIDFSDQIRFLGYDVVTDPYGHGSVRMYWQRLSPMDKNYNLLLFFADEQGAPRQDVTLPSSLLFWYPTAMWRPGETVVGQTVPLDLGPSARVGLAVLNGSNWDDAENRLPARLIQPDTLRVFDDSTWVELGTLRKEGNRYVVE